MQSCERASLVCSNFFQFVEKAYILTRAIVARESRARDELSIVEAIRNSITTAVLELDRARDLPWKMTSLVRLAYAAPSKSKFHGDEEHDHSPRRFSVHTCMGESPRAQADHRAFAVRPIRTVCAWCAGHDRPTAVLVDVPIDDRGLSHGICSPCRSIALEQGRVRRGEIGACRLASLIRSPRHYARLDHAAAARKAQSNFLTGRGHGARTRVVQEVAC